jgi:hypothetical protein
MINFLSIKYTHYFQRGYMQQDRWRNRRRMAWLSLLAGLGFPLLLLYSNNTQLGAVAGPFYIFVMGVVGTYIGFATIDDKWQQNDNVKK